jgi:DNA polymerase-3 subunit gamma/tau
MDDPATPEPERPGSSPPPQLDAAGVRRAWDEILGMVNSRNKRIAALARNATVRDLEGDTLVLTFQSSVLASMMSKEAGVLSDAIYEVLGSRWELRCEVAGDQRPGPAAQAARPAAERKPAAARGQAGTPERKPAQPSTPERKPAPAQGQASARERKPAQESTLEGKSAGKPAQVGDWPEPARPGGEAARPEAKGGNPPEAAPAARPASNGLAAARAAAAGRGARTPSAPATADTTWAGEPPYDPDYDRPRPGAAGARPTTATAYEGFDPGDEPTDEVVDERTARQSSEQQAMQLLQQTFGAEKIGEV